MGENRYLYYSSPFRALTVAKSVQRASRFSLGVMLLAACPGGPTSNLITYLVKGNVALSITLTAITTLITVFTIPLVVNLSMQNFMGEGTALQLPFWKTVIQIALSTLIPISIGMLLHHYTPKWAQKVEKSVKWLSLFFLSLIIVGLLLKEPANVTSFFLQVGWVTLTLNIIMMAVGYKLATFSQLDRPRA